MALPFSAPTDFLYLTSHSHFIHRPSCSRYNLITMLHVFSHRPSVWRGRRETREEEDKERVYRAVVHPVA